MCSHSFRPVGFPIMSLASPRLHSFASRAHNIEDMTHWSRRLHSLISRRHQLGVEVITRFAFRTVADKPKSAKSRTYSQSTVKSRDRFRLRLPYVRLR